VSSGKPWKIYSAYPGSPRLLIGTYDKLTEAANAFRDLTAEGSETLRFKTTLHLGREPGLPMARFIHESRPFVIEYEE
jgi:hypothetical protein